MARLIHLAIMLAAVASVVAGHEVAGAAGLILASIYRTNTIGG